MSTLVRAFALSDHITVLYQDFFAMRLCFCHCCLPGGARSRRHRRPGRSPARHGQTIPEG